MTDAELDALKKVLDGLLHGRDRRVGIRFGQNAFSGFVRRGWIEEQTFTAFGTGAFPIRLKAYDETHFVAPDFAIDDDQVEIGNDPQR